MLPLWNSATRCTMKDIEAYMTDVYFARLALWGLEPVASK